MAQKRKDYIPNDKYELEAWGNQFATTVTNNVDNYGITQELADEVSAAAQDYSADLVAERQLIDQKRVQVKKTQTDRKTLQKQCRSMAQMIKSNPAYTEAIGKEFDIIGAEVQIDLNTAKPVLSARKAPHGWELSFGLNGYFSGVNIYRKHPGEEQFTYLATDTRSPYVDNSPAENGTQYYAYFIVGDTEVGVQSDVVTIEV
uniref:hypothetical protein n=1 Tax=uncultured Draconibacterium sp. TaxID=1573823 RepID=UPI0032170801